VFAIVGFLIVTVFEKKLIFINASLIKIIYCLLLITLLAIVADVLNNTRETFFIYNTFSTFLIIVGAFVLAFYFKKINDNKIDFDLITNYIIAAVTLQCLLAVLMYLIPGFEHFMLEQLTISPYSKDIRSVRGQRLIGIGEQYVALGIINSFGLVMLSEKLKKRSPYTVLQVCLFVFIVVIGCMMSRTTIIGAATAIIILVVFNRHRIRQHYGKILIAIVCVAIVYLGILPNSIKSQFDYLFQYAFEMFFSYESTGTLQTRSTNDLIGMLSIIPHTFKTWLIGDGFWDDPTGRYAYYMGTDVGYTRLLFYFGIGGLIMYLYYQYQIIKQANLRTKNKHRQFFIFIFILFLILQIKVLVDVIPIFILFMFAEEDDSEIILEESKKIKG
jgi:hypothetical protein